MPRLGGRAILQPLHDPVVVVAVSELGQRLAQLGQVFEVADPQQLLFEGSKESYAVPHFANRGDA